MRLGVNIDHVATIRNARKGVFPDPVAAAQVAIDAGADSITAHLREDRRHIQDEDIRALKGLKAPLNLEMAASPEMMKIALAVLPADVCLVPEKREELTTEGGLDVQRCLADLTPFVATLKNAGIKVSLFIDPEKDQIYAAKETGADAIEIHTGEYANNPKDVVYLNKVRDAASLAASLGLKVHAGHGLTFKNVEAIAAIPEIEELNIGHFLVAQSVFTGLGKSVREMKELMLQARS